MSEWKEESTRYKDERHTHAEDKPVGKAKKRTPSPKKRPRETPLWCVRYDTPGRWAWWTAYVSAETAAEARKKAPQTGPEGWPIFKVERLHQKDRDTFADLIDQPRFLAHREEMARRYPTSSYWKRYLKPTEGEQSDGTNT